MDKFDERFAELAGPMLHALERRALRARKRAEALPRQDDGKSGERERWLELEADYRRAYDGLHTALVRVRYAAGLLRRLNERYGEG